ncbi:MAG: DUF748 domain-containing protein [Planctomycetota bacterium]|jgi:hypothetical protein
MKKGKIKKIIRIALVTLAVVLVTGILIFKLYGNQLLRTAIVTGVQKALQVDVRLDSIDLKVVAGKVDLQNMEIDNPEGYNHPTFLKLGHAYMDLDVASLTSDTISMDMVQLENINLVIEQKGTTNNLKEILNNLPKSEATESEPEPAEEGPSKNVRIKVLEINNIEVKAKLLPIPGQADTVTLRIKPIRMENLGTDEKIDFAGLTAKILKAISKGVAEQGAGVLPMDMVGSIGDELGKQVEALLEGAKSVEESASDMIKDLGGLFKKKEE